MITIGLYTLAFILSIHASKSVRTPQGAVAWMFFFFFCPWIAPVVYLVLGPRKLYKGHDELDKLQIEFLDSQEKVENRDTNKWSITEQICGDKSYHFKALEFLNCGDQYYRAILSEIEKAEHYILFQYYIIRNDSFSDKIFETLRRKRDEGVQVYIIYDQIGCLLTNKQLLLPDRGFCSESVCFQPYRGMLSFLRVNHRNHRKIFVRDGIACITGGYNIGEEYLNGGSKFQQWHDSSVLFEGPLVARFEQVFLRDWYLMTKETPTLEKKPHKIDTKTTPMTGICLATGPLSHDVSAEMAILHLITEAKERFWITSPYFVPSRVLYQACKLAIKRGVDVRIQVPIVNDSKTALYAGRAYCRQFANIGADITLIQNGFTHRKIFLIDNKYGYMGSSNFDYRSMNLNFECGILSQSDEFIRQIESIIVEQTEKGVSFDHNTSFSKYTKVLEDIAKLFTPVL